MVFSDTRNNSLTPLSANHLASSITSTGWRETNAPRNCGIAQNEHLRSQPEAIFKEAHGSLVNLLRAKSETRTRSAGAIGSNLRRSCGVCGVGLCPDKISPSRAEIS